MIIMRNLGKFSNSFLHIFSLDGEVGLCVESAIEKKEVHVRIQAHEARQLARYLIECAEKCEKTLEKKEVKIKASDLSRILDFSNMIANQNVLFSESSRITIEDYERYMKFLSNLEVRKKEEL